VWHPVGSEYGMSRRRRWLGVTLRRLTRSLLSLPGLAGLVGWRRLHAAGRAF
jgi:hypothetical protein